VYGFAVETWAIRQVLAIDLTRKNKPMHTIIMYGAHWCPDCKRARQFLGEQRIDYEFIDIDDNPSGQAKVEQYNNGKQIIPTLVFEDGTVLVEPSNAELAAKLGIQSAATRQFYDLIVIGSGPAGLTTALYTAREGIETLVIERGGVGGQAGITEQLDNFPGFPEGVSGAAFADRLRQQAERFGVEILSAQNVTSVRSDGRYHVVATADGSEYCASAVLLALGSTYRRLNVAGEEDFIGAGVHFCATCDGAFYRDKDVMVIGGGNSAGEEGIFLTRFARRVTIVVRGAALTASKVIAQKIEQHPQIEVLTNHSVTELRGENRLATVVLQNNETSELIERTPDGVFVFVGLTPNTEMVRDTIQLDEHGFVDTDLALSTSVPGVFAAGDCRHGSTKQAASAAGEGAAVALSIRRYIESQSDDIVQQPRIAQQLAWVAD
jgi:thioredoxin reductase (NADPH)